MRKELQKEKKFLWLCFGFCALALLSLGIRLLFSRDQVLTERIYSQGVYPPLAQLISRITGLFPVSLSEIGLVLLFVLVIVQIVRLFRKKTNLLRLLAGLLAIVSFLYSVFTLGWAINYDRQPYAVIADLPVRNSSPAELEELCMELVENANALRRELSTEDTAYKTSETISSTLSRVQAAYTAASAQNPWLAGRYGNPKAALFSLPLAYMNIAGIYSPITFEAHVNALESDLMLPATACHEAAHLRGFAREDEANYIAYVVCCASGDTRFAYAGTLLALIHAGNQLNSVDRQAFLRVYMAYSPGLAADLNAYNENWEPYDGKAAEIHEKVNDAYLKSNGQASGVRSYGRMVDLLLAEKRKREGRSDT